MIAEPLTYWHTHPTRGSWEVTVSHPGCDYCRELVPSAIVEVCVFGDGLAGRMTHLGAGTDSPDGHTIDVESLARRPDPLDSPPGAASPDCLPR